MEIRFIATDTDYDEALAEIRRLWKSAPGSRGRNKLEVLAMLAHRYERERDPLPALDPVDAIKFRMEQKGLSRNDLVRIFGSSGRTSEVLNGKRPLSIDMIRRLHSELDIPLECLIQPSRRRPARRKRASKRQGRRAA